ncbi:MAG TPA: hypothetical protein VLK84_31140 [Longimicrobium sp.]|nr:hypothetical protein [Longimicrobium sp.]
MPILLLLILGTLAAALLLWPRRPMPNAGPALDPDSDRPSAGARARARAGRRAGAEMARAEAAEVRRTSAEPGTSPMPAGEYDASLGHHDLTDPARIPLDAALAQLGRRYAASGADERAALRGAIGMEELYRLLAFARRAAVFAIREGDAGGVRDALAAVAMIEAERVDFRDVLMAVALLHHAAGRVGEDGDALLREAATLAEPGTAALLARFADRAPAEKHVRTAFGYAEVRSAGGAGFVGWGFRPYAPVHDLGSIASDLAALLAADHYLPSVMLADNLPDHWLQPGGTALADALAAVRAGASVSGYLRPEVHPEHEAQQLTVFLVETVDEGAARTLLELAENGAPRDHVLVAAAEGPLFCLVIARSFVDGVEAYETQENLARFTPRIAGILRRHRLSPA